MKLNAYQFKPDQGWSTPLDAALDSPSTLIVVFGPPDEGTCLQALEALISSFPNSLIVGCSSAGEIYGEGVFDDTLSVSVTQFERSKLKLAYASVSTPEESLFAGRDIAERLNEPDLKMVFALSDGLAVNGSKLTDGFNMLFSDDIFVTGGLAGDGSRFEKTWVLMDGRPTSGIISAVGLYGTSLSVSHGSKGGWDTLESELTVTHSIGNVLYELDDQIALDVYKHYMGKDAEGLPASGLLYPLALKNDEEADGYTVRTILAVDEKAGSITFAGDIPDDTRVQLMRADFGHLIDGAAQASSSATSLLETNRPVLSIAISCVGRRLVLGERTKEELEATYSFFPEGSHQIGFYSYGEISPLASGHCDLHNQTMTLTLIGEE